MAERVLSMTKNAIKQRLMYQKHREKRLAYGKAWRAANPEKDRACKAAWEAANKDRVRENRNAWKRRNPDKVLASERRRQGHPTPTRPQPDECECCGKLAAALKKSTFGNLCLDHDHKTGHFRGWLCDSCNLGLGMLGDDEDGVRRALTYLQRASQP